MSENKSPELYHEKQRLQFCLIHTLNNIMQKHQFTSSSLDEICYSFNESRWFNPHKSWIGLGNYDANILMAALQMNDLKMTWFDKRLSAKNIKMENVKAIVFNVPSKTLMTLYRGRHWFPVLQKDGVFYNMDSKLKKPERIDDIYNYVDNHNKDKDIEIMLVLQNDMDDENVFDKSA